MLVEPVAVGLCSSTSPPPSSGASRLPLGLLAPLQRGLRAEEAGHLGAAEREVQLEAGPGGGDGSGVGPTLLQVPLAARRIPQAEFGARRSRGTHVR